MSDKPEFSLDENLILELRAPGSDRRFGVNVIARPPAEIRDQIIAVQNQLKTQEPGQYYYPPEDLHLTVLEIGSGWDESKANFVFEQVRNRVGPLLKRIRPCLIERPWLRFDRHAGAVAFEDATSLEQARRTLLNRLKADGIPTTPRSSTGSAHITFMRYVTPLTVHLQRWASARKTQGSWTVREAWLSHGATWYGRQSRINHVGPYAIGDLSAPVP